jgi:hypothetical protein
MVKLNKHQYFIVKSIRFISAFLVLLILPLQLSSQSCANYSVTRTTGITYTTIANTGANSFIWRNTLAATANNDNRTISTPLGFDFWYLGTRYTNFSASLNGFVDFSSSTNIGTPGSSYGPLNGSEFSDGGSGGTMLTIAPMYDDLWTPGAGTAAIATSMLYKVTGTSPNRVLTVEWINFEKWKVAPYWTSPPALNFQLKIYETSGVIQFIYGSMNAGNATFDYASGINGFWTPASAPTSAQLKTQQTANSTSFNELPQNNLTTIPASSTQIQFTPLAPSPAPTAFGFSSVSASSMNLNWTDNANNELGYVILNSTDNVNFSFVAQTAANSNSINVNGLLENTTYYWRLHAVTEGDLGSALTGTQATTAAANVISVASGNWNTTSTWNCGCIPDADYNVTIANSHTVSLDGDASCQSITVGQGSSGVFNIGNNGTARNFNVLRNVSVLNGASFTTGTNTATHNMTLRGNLSNESIFDLAPNANAICNITFNSKSSQTISGTGSTTNFNLITLDIGNDISNVLEINSSTFSTRPSNFLTLKSGMFKLSAPSNTTLTPYSGISTIAINAGIWINNVNANLYFGNTINLLGTLRCSAGTLSLGDLVDENIISNGGNLIIDGGTANIAGRYGPTGLSSLSNFTLSSGTIRFGVFGSTTAGEAIFRINEQGSQFSMSGGSLVLRRSGAGSLGFVNTSTTNVSVSGGTLFIGDGSTPASTGMFINSSANIPNLTVGSTVAITASLTTNSLTVLGGITINTATLNTNNLNLALSGNWENNGNFEAGTSSVTFNGTNAQQISGTSTTTFNNIVVNNSNTAGITLASPVQVVSDLVLTNGRLITSTNNIITMPAGSATSGGNANSFIDGPIEKIGTTAFVFPVGDGARWARIGIGAPSTLSTFRAEYFASPFSSVTAMAATPTPSLNNVSKTEYWQLDRTSGAGNAAVTLFWENSTFSGITDCSTTDLRIARFNSGTASWENINNTVTITGTCTGASAGSISTNSVVTNFSPFSFGSLSSGVNPLPIELIYFSAELNTNKHVVLNWETATELNNDYFTIEKSKDAVNFTALDVVDAAGNSSVRKKYTYVDQNPYDEVSYYRLKQTDFDLTYSYSDIITIKNKNNLPPNIYPNPNNGSLLNIKLYKTFGHEINLTFYETIGKMAYATTILKSNNEAYINIQLNLKGILKPGIYNLRISAGDNIYYEKIIITNP